MLLVKEGSRKMTYDQTPLRTSQKAIEAAALACISSIGTNFQISSINRNKLIARSSLRGITIYLIYQTLLTGLRTEASRRKGEINRAQQTHILINSILDAISTGATVSGLIGILLLIFPWLSIPLSLIGLIGVGKASLTIFNVFWSTLETNEKAELLQASREAGISLRMFLNGDENKSSYI